MLAKSATACEFCELCLQEVLGATRAVDVIRRFRADRGPDPYQEITRLQESVREARPAPPRGDSESDSRRAAGGRPSAAAS